MKILKVNRTSTEYNKLRELWTQVFGDDPSEVDQLYDKLNANGYLLEENGQALSCLTTFTSGTLNAKPVTTVYAVCTNPDYRGQGYASKLIKQVLADIEADGAIPFICPAEESLASFYRNLGFEFCDYALLHETSSSDEVDIRIEAIDAKRYAEIREEFLESINHVLPRQELLEQVREFSVNSNGMLLINGGDAICIVDRGTDDEMYISELLVNPTLLERSSEIADIIAASLAAKLESARCIYRTTGNDASTPYYGLEMK